MDLALNNLQMLICHKTQSNSFKIMNAYKLVTYKLHLYKHLTVNKK